MKYLDIMFPTAEETALRNAAEYRGVSARARLDCLLDLMRTVEAISKNQPNRTAQVAEHDRMKDAELQMLIRTQVHGHV